MKPSLEGLRRWRQGLRTRLNELVKGLHKAAPRPDARDLAVFGGLALLANGVRQIYSPAAWIVVGLFFMWISLRRKPV